MREGASHASPESLAAAFIADTADQKAPWLTLFALWAQARGLSEEGARAVRITILRRRTFSALKRNVERAR